MAAVTYPNEEVATLLNDELVPVQLQSNEEPYVSDYNVKWTPSFFILDEDGKVHLEQVGFLPPHEFIPWVHLGMGKAFFDLEQYPEALDRFNTVVDEYPDSKQAPEAVYLRGVTKYKMSHASDGLIEAYDILTAKYPHSEWAEKAKPYRLLKEQAA